MKHLPNILTLSRLALLPFIIACLFKEWVWLALALYIIATLTDYFDGWLARKLNHISAFGTFLDPISDKIFVASLLIVFAGIGRIYGLALIPAILIIAREFFVSGLREYLGPKNIQLPVTTLAKWKTATQMLATGILIIAPYIPHGISIGHWALALAALITVITGWGYIKAAGPHLKG